MFGNRIWNSTPRRRGTLSFVGVTRSTYAEIHEKIGLAINRGGGIDLRNGDRVVIKINLCNFRTPETGAVTHPIFLDAVLSYLRSLSKKVSVFIVESDATVARPDRLIHWLGLVRIFKKYNAMWVNLTKDQLVKRRIEGQFFHEMEIPKTIADSDHLITMPKLKTHTLTKITCSLKNQFGCIPYRRKVKFHPVLDDAIVDACLAMRPDFCIVDGILGMGGVKGPDLGTPIRSNVVVTGRDAVSVDSVCARIMGFDPHSIGHIEKAQKAGIGQMAFKIIGENLTQVRRDFEFNHLYARIINLVMSWK